MLVEYFLSDFPSVYLVNAPLCVLVTANSSVYSGVVTSACFAIYLN